MSARNSRAASGSMPVVGSSRNSTFASPISPRARCSRCFMPREYVSTRSSARSVIPTRSSSMRRPLADLRTRELVERAPVLEVLAPGQPPVEAALAAEDDPDQRPHGARLRDDVVTEHRRAAARRQEHGREDLHERRLAGAVRPEQPVHLAGRDRQRDAVERIDRLSLARRENAADLVHDDCVHCRDSFRRLPWAGVVLRKLLIAAALAGIAAVPAGAQVTAQSLLMPGVSYQRQVEFTPHGPVVLDVVIAPRPDGSLYTLAPALSNNAIVATQTLTDMEKDASATVDRRRRQRRLLRGEPREADAASSCAAACSSLLPQSRARVSASRADGTLTVARRALRRHVARQRPAAAARPQRAGGEGPHDALHVVVGARDAGGERRRDRRAVGAAAADAEPRDHGRRDAGARPRPGSDSARRRGARVARQPGGRTSPPRRRSARRSRSGRR